MERAHDTVLRRELYEQVWTTPLIQLAEQYGVSNIALARTCDDNDIPRPPAGYWSQLRAGKAPPKPPLPGSESQYVIFEPQSSPAPPETAPEKSPANAEGETPAVPAHPLVAAARAQLTKARPDESRRLQTKAESAVYIHVAPGSVARAIALFASIVQQWQERGGEVNPCRDGRGKGTVFAMGEDCVLAGLIEQTGEVEGGRKGALITRTNSPHNAQPNGRLSFCIENGYGVCIRSTWSDCKKYRLENRIHAVVECLGEHVQHNRCQRLDRESESRQKERAKACREARESRRAKDVVRIERLENDSAAWERAERFRSFAGAVRGALDKGPLRVPDQMKAEAWLDWVHWYANVLDPLVEAGPCPSHPVQPKNLPVADIDLTHRTREVVEFLGVKDGDGLFRVTEDHIRRKLPYSSGGVWSEVTLVLEGLGYDVSNRRYWDWSTRTQQQGSLADSLKATE